MMKIGIETKLEDLPKLFSMRSDKFFAIVNYLSNHQKYKTFTIKKKKGGDRLISAPIPPLKYLQKKLANYLYMEFKFKNNIHGFVLGKSIKTNAEKHLNKKIFFSLDLKDFFPTITSNRVYGLFKAILKCNNKVAIALTKICCDNNGLPQGAPTSPIISNLICRQLDIELLKFSYKYHFQYTRYADDLSFSGNTNTNNLYYKNDDGKNEINQELYNIIKKNGFFINENKVYIRSQKERQICTGIKINKKLNLNKKYIDEIKLLLHLIEKYEFEDVSKRFFEKYRKNILSVLHGRINYVKYIKGKNDGWYNKLAKRFNSIKAGRSKIKDLEVSLSQHELIEKNVWQIENSETAEIGTGFLLKPYGFVTCYHIIKNDENLPHLKITRRGQSDYQATRLITKDINKDFAILEVNFPEAMKENSFEIGDMSYKPRDKMILAGYPNPSDHDSITIQEGTIIKKISSEQFAISERIIGGNSGGPILNSELKVIGIAKAGLGGMQRNLTPKSVISCNGLNELASKVESIFLNYPDASADYVATSTCVLL